MEVRIARRAGFCMGVRRAVAISEGYARQDLPVYSLGPVIHNEDEMRRLAAEGISVIDTVGEGSQGRVVIRAHGAPPEVFAQAEALGIPVADATCPLVTRLQQTAVRLARAGFTLVVIGDPRHPEVIGVKGWAGTNTRVVQTEEEAAALPPLDRVGVVVQTTQREDKVRVIVEILRTKTRHLQFENTICAVTKEWQGAARDLAREVDVMVVVGGRASSNTQKLAGVARDVGAQTHLIENADDLDPSWFPTGIRVGITAGASTPDWVIAQVQDRLEGFGRQQTESDLRERSRIGTP